MSDQENEKKMGSHRLIYWESPVQISFQPQVSEPPSHGSHLTLRAPYRLPNTIP